MNLALALALALALSGCAALKPKPPQTIVRVDTVTVTKEVAPPLPNGDTVTICLSTGVPVQVRIAASGDTLIGEKRIAIKDVRPTLAFPGMYTSTESWFTADTVRFENRVYRKNGVALKRACDELKLVGSHLGVPVFAEVTAPEPLPAIILPVRVGLFQTYFLVTPSKRRR